MIWFLAPLAFTAGAGGSWWITKETATDVIEATQNENPQVVIGSNYNMSSALIVIVILLIVWFVWLRKKGKR